MWRATSPTKSLNLNPNPNPNLDPDPNPSANAKRLCVVVWLFDLQPGEAVTLRFRFPAADARAAAAGLHELGALAAVRRAQAAKQLVRVRVS